MQLGVRVCVCRRGRRISVLHAVLPMQRVAAGRRPPPCTSCRCSDFAVLVVSFVVVGDGQDDALLRLLQAVVLVVGRCQGVEGGALVSQGRQRCAAKHHERLWWRRRPGCQRAVADQQPFTDAQGTLMVFSASNTECCACYELEFQNGPLSGRRAVTQVTNSGTDLGAKHFDLMMPGGGFGIFNGCTGPSGQSESAWGARYGGVTSRAACDNLPADVQQGCRWRFDSSGFAGADNPSVRYRRVRCPRALTQLSLCALNDDDQFPAHTASSTSPAGGLAPIAPPSTSGCVAKIASGASFSGRCMSSTAACLASGAAPGAQVAPLVSAVPRCPAPFRSVSVLDRSRRNAPIAHAAEHCAASAFRPARPTQTHARAIRRQPSFAARSTAIRR
jgi:hypothetical protein